jgi:hypothetical protein
MSVELYVGNLSIRVLHSTLEKLSARVGTVRSVAIVDKAQAALSDRGLKKLGIQPMDKVAVIRMASKTEARAAVDFLHGRRLFGRKLIAMAGPHGPIEPEIPE